VNPPPEVERSPLGDLAGLVCASLAFSVLFLYAGLLCFMLSTTMPTPRHSLLATRAAAALRRLM
jgi:hypothetical protein